LEDEYLSRILEKHYGSIEIISFCRCRFAEKRDFVEQLIFKRMETTKKEYSLLPTFGDSFGTGWNVMSDNFLRLLLVAIVISIIAAPMNVMQWKVDPSDFHFNTWDFEDFWRFSTLGLFAAFYGLLALLYVLLVAPVFRFGAKMMYVQAVRQEKPDFEYLIKGFRENYLSIVLANLLVFALVGIGLFALLIPGIIIGCRLAFVSYIVMDKKVDPVEALEMSWKLTRGHGWTIFFMGFTAFFIYIFGLLLLIVGIYPAAIWVSSSFASLYESVLRENAKPDEATQAA